MQIKYILKSLVLTSLCAKVYAAKDDCKELKSFLKEAMTNCIMNENGEMIELGFNTYLDDVTEEGYRKAFSYPTLKKLVFYDEYDDCVQLSYGLSNLKNLEELSIRSFRGGLAPNTIKGLTSLKKFYFTTGDYVGGLDKEALEELGTLTNLESLSFSFSHLNEEGLKALQNLNKVTSLTLSSNGKASMDVEGCLANLKNLKELTVGYDIKHQSEVDAITSYTNLEKLTVSFDMNEIKCDNMKNLTKLNTLIIGVNDTKMPSCVNSIPNLQKLTFNTKDIPLQNGNNSTTGNNTNQTAGNNSNQTTENNTNQATGNNTNQAAGNNTNQAAGNDVNQATGNNADQITGNIANGNTTTTNEPNDDINIDSGVGSTMIVHGINYLPIIALIFKILL